MIAKGFVLQRATPELQALVELFYGSLDEVGDFQEVADQDLPPIAQQLLAHDGHMTVTLETHYGCSMDVCVLESLVTKTHYARRILLKGHGRDEIVQFGIVRLNLDYLSDEVRREIEGESTPLGRTLISHGVLRRVRLLSLWKVEPEKELCRHFGFDAPKSCYGRTALIYCDGVPAVELLEIVTCP